MDNKNFMSAFEQYNKSHEQKNRVSGEELLKKYFQPRLGTQRVRLMPPLDGEEYFERAYFHMVREIAYNRTTGKTFLAWKKHYCVATNDPKVEKFDKNGELVLDKDGKPVKVKPHCSLCAKKDEILATQDQSVVRKKEVELTTQEQKTAFLKNKEIFKNAMEYAPKEFILVRILDLDKISDGVKIWQFPSRKDQKGVHDLLMSAITRFHKKFPDSDWTSITNGCTFELVNVEVTAKNGNKKVEVQTIYADEQLSPAINDNIIIKKLSEDTTKWTDLHKKKDRAKITHDEYLKRVITRTNPYYNNEEKKWIFPDPKDFELQSNANNRSDEDLTSNSSDDKESNMVNAVLTNELKNNPSQPDMDSLTQDQVNSMPTIQDSMVSSGIDFNSDDTDDLPF